MPDPDRCGTPDVQLTAENLAWLRTASAASLAPGAHRHHEVKRAAALVVALLDAMPSPELVAWLISSGVLPEANRTVAHPVGVAFSVDPEIGIIGCQDAREDPEGFYFDAAVLSVLAERREAWERAVDLKSDHREHRLGYVVQPVPAAGE
jgi:hypothetical protein